MSEINSGNPQFEPYDAAKVKKSRMEQFYRSVLYRLNLNQELKNSLRLKQATIEEKVDVLSAIMLAFLQESLEDSEIQSQVWAAEQEEAVREFLYGEDLTEIVESHSEFLFKKRFGDSPHQRITKVAKYATHAFNREQGYENPVATTKSRLQHYSKPVNETARAEREAGKVQQKPFETQEMKDELAFRSKYPSVRTTIIDLLEDGKYTHLHAEPNETAMRLIVLTESLNSDEKVRNLDADKMSNLRIELRALVGNERDKRKPYEGTKEDRSLAAISALTRRYKITPINFRNGSMNDVIKVLRLDETLRGLTGAQRAVAEAYVAYGLKIIFRSETDGQNEHE